MEESAGQRIRNYYKVAAPFYDADQQALNEDAGLDDIGFYLDLARRTGGPTLEFGCGTGRIGLALLRAGITYTGVDLAPAMVDAFKAKLAAEPETVTSKARVKEGDVRSTHLDRRFGCAILPGNVLSHILDADDRRRALNRLKAHLTPGGVIAFDITTPSYEKLGQAAAGKLKKEVEELERPGEGKNKVRRLATTEYDLPGQALRIQREWQDVGPRGGSKTAAEAALDLRFIHRFELELMLKQAGFDIVAIYGDVNRAPYDASTGQLVVIARLVAPVAVYNPRPRKSMRRRPPMRSFGDGPGGGMVGPGGRRAPGRFRPGFGRPGFSRPGFSRPGFGSEGGGPGFRREGGYGGPPRPYGGGGGYAPRYGNPDGPRGGYGGPGGGSGYGNRGYAPSGPSQGPGSGYGPEGEPRSSGSSYGAPPPPPAGDPGVRDSGTTEFPRPTNPRPPRPSFGPPLDTPDEQE